MKRFLPILSQGLSGTLARSCGVTCIWDQTWALSHQRPPTYSLAGPLQICRQAPVGMYACVYIYMYMCICGHVDIYIIQGSGSVDPSPPPRDGSPPRDLCPSLLTEQLQCSSGTGNLIRIIGCDGLK
jgi:hypothetical protein